VSAQIVITTGPQEKVLIPVQIAAQIAAMAGVSLDYIYLGGVSGVKVGVLNTLSAARPRT
jgi:hypothetical protein